ncbi:hypothetical protein J437_LFUL008178 [Ladona fulva]|uniref:Uncharacterized protein n=1 Tax=Ladona fulva TaxID=123851 RepID=A0A8K0K7I5_LADFU|nr:hypothetical protein J437_LFUL008178 [Ladona fulva]
MQANESMNTTQASYGSHLYCPPPETGKIHRKEEGGMFALSMEDTNWVLTSSFIIFTMQTAILVMYRRTWNVGWNRRKPIIRLRSFERMKPNIRQREDP